MKVGFLTMEKVESRKQDSVGSSRIRARWVWERWEDAEEYQIGKKYDCLIFQKAYIKRLIDGFDGIKIFDLCDPDWMHDRPVFEMIQSCDAVTTSTPSLCEYISKMVTNKPVICIPDRLCFDNSLPFKEHKGELKKLVWYGYAGGAYCLDPCLEAISSRNLELSIMRDKPVNFGKKGEFINQVDFNQKMFFDFVTSGDAVLMPERNDKDKILYYKSNNKTIQAWQLGMPVVETEADLEKFRTAESRNDEARKRYEEVKRDYDVLQSVQQYKDLISEIQKTKGR